MPPKSGVSRTRNVEYDDDVYDDDDDYYEDEQAGDGFSEDDKEQMRVGTERAREALGDLSDFISDAQIQEALWHYYYDVGKSVSYLKNKLEPSTKQQTPKKEKTSSRFDQAASVADRIAPVTTGKQSCDYLRESIGPVAPLPSLPISTPFSPDTVVRDFFWDVPWGMVPSDRWGHIIVEAPVFRGGLLGGSSKLAALAAKRRKEREDAEAAAAKPSQEADAAIAMLDKLALKAGDGVSSTTRGEAQEKSPSRARYPARRRSPSPEPAAQIAETDHSKSPQPAIVSESPAQRASASMFASTLCGAGNPAESQPSPSVEAFSAPYMQYGGSDCAKGFAGPSPDDIVREAQAKGAGGRR